MRPLAAAAVTIALTCVSWLMGVSAAVAATGLRASSSARPATAQACYDFAVRALQHHVVVDRMPPACAGLAAPIVNEAVARAVRTVVGPLPKAAGRRQVAADSRYLGGLIRSAGPGRPSSAVAGPEIRASTVPARLATLVAWLAAAIAGAWLLTRRLSRRLRAPGAWPWVPASHASVATAGLALWVAFLLTGSPLIGWLDVALTWLIAGLGMATLLADPAGRYGPPAVAGMAAGPSTATLASIRAPVLTIALHGALAAATMALALLAVIGVD